MLVIGLTGSSGSGKSTVSQMLQEQEFDVILSHAMLSAPDLLA